MGNQGVPCVLVDRAQIGTSSNVSYYFDSQTASVSTPVGPPVATSLGMGDHHCKTDLPGLDAALLDNRLEMFPDRRLQEEDHEPAVILLSVGLSPGAETYEW